MTNPATTDTAPAELLAAPSWPELGALLAAAGLVEVFTDSETTGLHDDARPWEIAVLPRLHTPPAAVDSARGPVDAEILLQITDVDLTTADPTALEIGGFYRRHVLHGTHPPEHITVTDPADVADWLALPPGITLAMPEAVAAAAVHTWTRGGHLIGVNAGFDARIYHGMLRRHGLAPAWHYHPHCSIDHAAGWAAGLVAGYRAAQHAHATMLDGMFLGGGLVDGIADAIFTAAAPGIGKALAFPRSSSGVSRLAGVEPPGPEVRHTAYADADWARRLWDFVHQSVTYAAAREPDAAVQVGKVCAPLPDGALAAVVDRLAREYLAWDGVQLLTVITYDGQQTRTDVIMTRLNTENIFDDTHAAALAAIAAGDRRSYRRPATDRAPIVGYALVVETTSGPDQRQHALIVAADTGGHLASVRATRGEPDLEHPTDSDPLRTRMCELVRGLATGTATTAAVPGDRDV